MFLLGVRVGLRPGEAAGVCVDCLDLEGDPPTVAVVRGIQVDNGAPHLVESLKTAGARRTLALPGDVVDALRVHLAATGITDGLVFRAHRGGPLQPVTARLELAELCEAAGVDPVAPNELRHTWATLADEAGLPPHKIADVLGHTSTRMVDAVYRHRPAVILGAETVELG